MRVNSWTLLTHNLSSFTHLWITTEDAETIHNFLGTGSSTDIKKVGRKATIQLDDVHCCHRKPCTIYCKKYDSSTYQIRQCKRLWSNVYIHSCAISWKLTRAHNWFMAHRLHMMNNSVCRWKQLSRHGAKVHTQLMSCLCREWAYCSCMMFYHHQPHCLTGWKLAFTVCHCILSSEVTTCASISGCSHPHSQ